MAKVKINYPVFKETNSGELYAFLSFDKTFHLKFSPMRGEGFEFRVYKTRATALRHWGNGSVISFLKFRNKLELVFGDYLLEITKLLPDNIKQIEDSPDNPQLSSGTKYIENYD